MSGTPSACTSTAGGLILLGLIRPAPTSRRSASPRNLGLRYRARATWLNDAVRTARLVGLLMERATTGKPRTTNTGGRRGADLGRHFDVVLEGMGSMGTAQWKSQPFTNSTGSDFNPSMVAGTLGFRYAWGETR